MSFDGRAVVHRIGDRNAVVRHAKRGIPGVLLGKVGKRGHVVRDREFHAVSQRRHGAAHRNGGVPQSDARCIRKRIIILPIEAIRSRHSHRRGCRPDAENNRIAVGIERVHRKPGDRIFHGDFSAEVDGNRTLIIHAVRDGGAYARDRDAREIDADRRRLHSRNDDVILRDDFRIEEHEHVDKRTVVCAADGDVRLICARRTELRAVFRKEAERHEVRVPLPCMCIGGNRVGHAGGRDRYGRAVFRARSRAVYKLAVGKHILDLILICEAVQRDARRSDVFHAVGRDLGKEIGITDVEIGISRQTADAAAHAEELPCGGERRISRDFRPALGCDIRLRGFRRRCAADIRLQRVIRRELVRLGRALERDADAELVKVERFALDVGALRVGRKLRRHGGEQIALHRGNGRERHIDELAVKHGVERVVAHRIGHADIGDEARSRRIVAVGDDDDVILAELPCEGDVLCLRVVLLIQLRTGGIDIPCGPVFRRRRSRDGPRLIVRGRGRTARDRAVIVRLPGAARKARQKAVGVADTVQQHPAVVTDKHGRARRILARRIGRADRGGIELAHRNTENGIVPRIVARADGLRRTRDGERHALSQFADGIGADFDVSARRARNRTERLDEPVGILRAVRRVAAVERAVIDRYGRCERRVGLHLAAMRAARDARRGIGIAELVLDRDGQRRCKRVCIVLLGRNGHAVRPDFAPYDRTRIVLAVRPRNNVAHQRPVGIDPQSRLRNFLVECLQSALFFRRLGVRKRDGSVAAVPDAFDRVFVCIGTRGQTQRQRH